MFSSSVINTAAATGSSNMRTQYHHHLQHQQLQVVSSYPDVFSDHHYTNLVPGMVVAQDAQQHDDEQVPIESAITYGNTIMDKQAGSDARVTKKKSDKRSKIRTSQGLRDRRVRLSIDIARKFFDLQDLLGFDKPSRTVEWLLNKSNKAILEVSAGASSSTTSSPEEAAGTEDGFKSLSSSRSTATCCTDQIQQVSSDDYLKTMKQKAALLTRESREKARARARARTLAKLCTSELNYCNFSSPSLSKDTYAEKQEARRKEEEQLKQKQQLQIHSYVVPNSNLSSLDWDISSVIPLPSSSATNRLNLSRDVEIYSRSSWDQLLLHNYRTGGLE